MSYRTRRLLRSMKYKHDVCPCPLSEQSAICHKTAAIMFYEVVFGINSILPSTSNEFYFRLQANSWQDTTNPPSVTSPLGPPGSVHSDTSNWSCGSPCPHFIHHFAALCSGYHPVPIPTFPFQTFPRLLTWRLRKAVFAFHKHTLCWNTGQPNNS